MCLWTVRRPMKYTFKSDDCMIITIPLGSLRDAQEGQLMPEKFHCVFKDAYKVFLKGQPKALGVCSTFSWQIYAHSQLKQLLYYKPQLWAKSGIEIVLNIVGLRFSFSFFFSFSLLLHMRKLNRISNRNTLFGKYNE